MTTFKRRIAAAATAIACALAIGVPAASNAQVLNSDPRRGIDPKLSPHVREVVPPQTNTLQPFMVPVYDGRVHFGLAVADPARPVQSQMSSQDILAFRSGDMISSSGFALYLDLLRLGENRDVITADRLAGLYTSARPPARTNGFMGGWDRLLINAAAGGLSDRAFRDVFCVDEAPCLIDGPGSVRPVILRGRSPVWGAGYNEFRFRAGFQKFVDKYLDDLVNWGASLDRRAISVGNVRMQSYDFATGSYVMQLDFGTRAKASRGLSNISTERYDLKFRIGQNGDIESVGLTWKLARDDARAVREKMQELGVNQLFVVVRGDIAFDQPDRIAANNDHLLAVDHYLDLTDDVITLYYDPSLSDEVALFPLRQ